MKIIKRNGAEVVFDIDKIIMAVTKANDAVDEKVRMTPLQIERISQSVQIACEEMGRSPVRGGDSGSGGDRPSCAHGAFRGGQANTSRYRYTRSPGAAVQHHRRPASSASSSATTRRPSRRTPTRTRSSTRFSGTTWPARSVQGHHPAACCCPRTSWRPTRRASSTSTTWTIMPSTCTTAIWSIWRTCCKTAPSSPAP